MRTWIAGVALALAAFTTGACDNSPDAAPTPTISPCAYEDSPGPCYWDATTMGNGQGRSFTVNADGTVTYLP